MADEDIRCGYCLQRLDAADEAKVLPCSHAFCVLCLQSDYKNVCPNCKKSFAGVAVEELRSFATTSTKEPSQEIILCTTCKADAAASATAFCICCKKLLCGKHEQLHDELFDLDHDKISVETYQSSGSKHTPTPKCSNHPKMILTHGCGLCHLLFCGECDFNKECSGQVKEALNCKSFQFGSLSGGFNVGSTFLESTSSDDPSGGKPPVKFSFGTSNTSSLFAGKPAENASFKTTSMNSPFAGKRAENASFGNSGTSSPFGGKPAGIFSFGTTSSSSPLGNPCVGTTTANSKVGSTPFGSTLGASPFGSTLGASPFGSTLGASPFGLTLSSSSSSSSIASGGLFGSVKSTAGGLFGQTTKSNYSITSASFTGFGAFSGALTMTGTTGSKFAATDGTDNIVRSGISTTIKTRHYHIAGMKQYETRSVEELRLDDYAAGVKGPKSTISGAPGVSNELNGFGFGSSSYGFGSKPTTRIVEVHDISPEPNTFPQKPGFGNTEKTTLANRVADITLQSGSKYRAGDLKGGQSNVDTHFKGQILHQFIPIVKFAEETRKEVQQKLSMVTSRCTEICESEKNTWRTADEAEAHADMMKLEVDKFIKEQCEHLQDMGKGFKTEIDTDAMRSADRAALFVQSLAAENQSLADLENSLSSKLKHRVGCEELLDALNTASPAIKEIMSKQVASFPTAKKSIKIVTGIPEAFHLQPYIPSGIQYLLSMNAVDGVSIICAMSNGDVLVGTAKNSIELRDSRLNILATKQLENQLLDIASSKSNILALERVGPAAAVNVYNKTFTHLQQLRDYKNSWIFPMSPGTVSLAMSKGQMTMADISINQLRIFTDGQEPTKIIILTKTPQCVCITDDGCTLFVFDNEVWLLNKSFTASRLATHVEQWTPMFDKPITTTFNNPTGCEMKVVQNRDRHISKTRDSSGFHYACFGNRKIMAFTQNGKKSVEFTHPQLTDASAVTAIAVYGEYLILGCGYEGIKLFGIV